MLFVVWHVRWRSCFACLDSGIIFRDCMLACVFLCCALVPCCIVVENKNVDVAFSLKAVFRFVLISEIEATKFVAKPRCLASPVLPSWHPGGP